MTSFGYGYGFAGRRRRGVIAGSVEPPAAPDAPTGLTADPGDGEVVLDWTPTPGATGHRVYRHTADDFSAASQIGTDLGAAADTYTDTTAVNDTTYFYWVTAFDGTGESGPSNVASATPTAPVAPEFVGAAAVQYVDENLTSFVVDVPSGVEEGHLLVLASAVRRDRTLNTPDGWTLRLLLNNTGTQNNRARLYVWTRVASDTEPASYTITAETDTTAVFGMLAYSGVEYGSVQETDPDNSLATTGTFPSINVTSVPAFVLRLWSLGGTRTENEVTSPPAGTQRVLEEVPSTALISTATGRALGVWEVEPTETGEIGTDTVTVFESEFMVMATMLLSATA